MPRSTARLARSAASTQSRTVHDDMPARTAQLRHASRRCSLSGKRILLIIGGGIAAYKSLDLIRRLRERGASVRCVMTAAAQEFVTPLSVGALTADHVFTELFDRQDEHDVGHIRLSREADLIVVAPATADLMAKLANGHANDLASTVLLATDKPVLMAPAMNPKMWAHPATRRNRATLAKDGVALRRPEQRRDGRERRGRRRPHGRAAGDRRRDRGAARHAAEAARRAARSSSPPARRMSRSTRCATSPTARRASRATPSPRRWRGSAPTCGSSPARSRSPIPAGVKTVHVETRATRCATRSKQLLPADAAVFVAAVADWRTADAAGEKIKKVAGEGAAGAADGREPRHPRRRRPPQASGPTSSSALPPRRRTC